jgi:ATP-binding cassette subfamily B (MDR/TAP) protein 10
MWQVAEEKLGNIRTVRAFAQEDKENAAFGSKVDDIQRLAYKEATARGIYWGSVSVVLLRLLFE